MAGPLGAIQLGSMPGGMATGAGGDAAMSGELYAW